MEVAKIVFVTGNENKVRELNETLSISGTPQFTSWDLNIPEIQGKPIDVAVHKCNVAFRRFQYSKAVLTEDSSLGFTGLGGLPGVYIKHFQEALGNQGLVDLLNGKDNRTACATCLFCYRRPGDSGVHVFRGITWGTIESPKGQLGFSWDPIFRPLGCDKTFGEMRPEEKSLYSPRGKALGLFKQFLLGQECTRTDQSGYHYVPDKYVVADLS